MSIGFSAVGTKKLPFKLFQSIHGTNSDDSMSAGIQSAFMRGYNGDDTITGSAQSDTIYGDQGDDWLIGGGGADEIWGGSDDDFIEGGSGHDTLRGGGDNDTIYGDAGDDMIEGGTGKDRLSGGAGSDTIFGGGDDDQIFFGEGGDLVFGDGGDDVFTMVPIISNGWVIGTVIGGEGNDTVEIFGDLTQAGVTYHEDTSVQYWKQTYLEWVDEDLGAMRLYVKEIETVRVNGIAYDVLSL